MIDEYATFADDGAPLRLRDSEHAMLSTERDHTMAGGSAQRTESRASDYKTLSHSINWRRQIE
ncbi:hypothetical protein LTS01_023284 [Friedmanniomyces endolithicus]|nr:hypothetical protein LTS01_023284 [Friedmanniomyces endolithicus]